MHLPALSRRLLVLPALLLPLLASGAGPARAEEPKAPAMPEKTGKKIDNPLYASWAKFKVGAWVRHAATSAMGEHVNKQTMTQKLVELTAEKAVVEMVMSVEAGGQKMDMPGQRTEHLKQMDEYKPVETPDEEKPKVKEGEEKLSAAGKEWACKTTEMTSKVGGAAFWSKVWVSPDLPGNMVKMESKSKAGEMDVTTTSVLEAWGEK